MTASLPPDPSTPGAPVFDPEFLQTLETLSVVSRRRVRGQQRGERRSIVRGRGIEFDDYRAYQPGDDYRYIDWNIVSRLDRLFVKLFSEEEDLDVHLLLDTSRSMSAGTPSKLTLAMRLAAAIGYIGLANLDRVAVTAFTSAPGPSLGRLRGRPRAFDLLQFLGALRPGGGTHMELALRHHLATAARRGLLIVLSDLLDPHGYEGGLLAACQRRFQTFVIHVMADEEVLPRLTGEVRLVDVETGHVLELTIDADARAAYTRARDSFFHEVERFCFRYGIDYLRTTSSVPLEDLILRYLRQGGLLR